MSLTTEQIKYIDNYLKFLKVEFIDVRIELVDHLACEFEHNSEFVLVGDFLRTKKNFVRSFQRETHKKKHWGYQKSLFQGILCYFILSRYMLISICVLSILYGLTFNLPTKIVGYLFFATLIIPQLVHLYMYKKPKDMHRHIQSAQYILSIMSFPSLFLYLAFSVFDSISQNPILFISYWFFAIISNLAALKVVIACKRKVLQQYKQLVG